MNTHASSHRPTRSAAAVLIVLAALALGTLACNLSSPPPPTLPPRQPTPTPQSTLGISTQVPLALPSGVQAQAPADPGVEALLRQVDPQRLMQHVTALYNVGSRYVNSAQNSSTFGIGAARDYIESTFESVAAGANGHVDVWPHTFTLNWGDVQTLQTNVVCTLQGTDTGAGVIVVSAHYDAVAYDVDSTINAPGADDNATGVAALLELARIMAQSQHRATIIFVAFSAEEVDRVGSIRFINEYLDYFHIDVRAVLNIDTIGNINGPNGQVNDRQIRIFSDDNNDHPARQLSRAIHLIASTYMPELQVVVQPAGDR
ncbi:MAG: M20/M25/M40 family metallo-hydrolase, partial [Anaerolineae bacterium]|nr:M20/M25/M40 family metallo-hydrolase [Anaerolineae bacterium]